MDKISRRSAIGAMAFMPAMGIAATPALAGAPEGGGPASALARAQWHFAELVRLLDGMEPTELHVVLQRTREAQA